MLSLEKIFQTSFLLSLAAFGVALLVLLGQALELDLWARSLSVMAAMLLIGLGLFLRLNFASKLLWMLLLLALGLFSVAHARAFDLPLSMPLGLALLLLGLTLLNRLWQRGFLQQSSPTPLYPLALLTIAMAPPLLLPFWRFLSGQHAFVGYSYLLLGVLALAGLVLAWTWRQKLDVALPKLRLSIFAYFGLSLLPALLKLAIALNPNTLALFSQLLLSLLLGIAIQAALDFYFEDETQALGSDALGLRLLLSPKARQQSLEALEKKRCAEAEAESYEPWEAKNSQGDWQATTQPSLIEIEDLLKQRKSMPALKPIQPPHAD